MVDPMYICGIPDDCDTGESIELEIPGVGLDMLGVRNTNSQSHNEKLKLDVKCPKCNSQMVKRSGKYGDFYGCSRYPECKGSRNT